MLKKYISIVALIIINLASVFSTPKELDNFIKAYPECNFKSKYIPDINDFLITVTFNSKTAYFYWADGRLLPQEEMDNKNIYNPLLYSYTKDIPDPQNFTDEDIQKIKEYTDYNNRQNSGIVPTYFYDFIYDCQTRKNAETHIISVSFLGKYVNINERIRGPLKNVENRINELAKTDDEVAEFVTKLARVDGYNWREISDSGKKSLHSVGIAIDILPKGWGQKNLYWLWRRDIDKENWMKLSLERRWTAPSKVIEAFEEEGFVYGGKWINWDNMHFEYTPEILYFYDLND